MNQQNFRMVSLISIAAIGITIFWLPPGRVLADPAQVNSQEIEEFFTAIQMQDTNALVMLEANTNLAFVGESFGKLPLLEAAAAGNVPLLKKMVELGADINAAGDTHTSAGSKNTALHWAIARNQPEACKFLLEAGADPNRMAFSFDTSLHLAFSEGREEMAGWLLDYGAQPFQGKLFVNDDTTPFELDITKSNGRLVPRMLGQDSQHPLGLKSLQKPRRSNRPPRGLKTAAEVLAQHGSALLASAAARGELEAVEGLLKAGVTVSNATDGLTVMQAFALASVSAQNSRPGVEQRLHQVQDQLKQDYIANADKNFVASLHAQEKKSSEELASLAPERWQKILNLLVNHHADYDALAATALNDTNQIARLTSTGKDAARSNDFAGNTPLHWAVQNDRLSLVSFWIQAGTPLDATNSAGQTALHLAAADGKIEFVKILLAAKAPTAIRDTNGWTPLDAAIQAKQSAIIHLLMADKSAPAHPERGISTTLHAAAASGNIAALAALVETETNLEVRNELGLTPLQVAGQAGQLGAAAFLIDQGADVNARDPDGNTVLHQILLSRTHWVKGRPSEAWVELRRKDPTQEKFWRVYSTPSGYTSPRELAASVAFFLACGTDPAATNHAGQTILQLVTADSTMLWDYDRNAILPLLQQRGNGLNERDAEGNTVLHRLCTGFYDVSKVENMASLIAAGADVNATNNLGQTPLHIAAGNIGGWDGNDPPVNEPFQLLVYSKANINARDNQGRTPLDVVTASDTSFKEEAAALLIKAGAKTGEPDKHGRTPVHLALSGEWPWRSAGANLQQLAASGADFSARDDQGKTPLHYLAALGDKNPMFFIRGVGDTFVKANVDFNARDNDGNTPLHIAAKTGTHDVFDWLLKQGADLDATNNAGKTPRMLALKNGNGTPSIGNMGSPSAELDIFQAIREGKEKSAEQILNADPQLANTPDQTGQTPLRLAVKLKQTNMVALLEARGANWDAPSAVMAGRADTVKKILNHKPAAITETADGQGLLHLAAITGDMDIYHQLLAANADMQAVDSFGLSPLGRAQLKSRTDAASLLLAHGATNTFFDAVYLNDTNAVSRFLTRDKSLVNATNRFNVSPVEIAAAAGYPELLESLLKAGGKASATITPFPTNTSPREMMFRFISSRWMTTPLDLAVFYNRTNAVQILIRADANVNQTDSRGFAPIHFAVLQNNLEMLSMLIQQKAKLNIASAQFFMNRPRPSQSFDMMPGIQPPRVGETPLHLAAMLGETNVVQLLLKSGADVNATNGFSRTPLDEANMTGRSFRANISSPAMTKPLEPLELNQSPVFVSSVSPENLKGIAAMIEAAGGKAHFSMPPTVVPVSPPPVLGDGGEYHNRGCSDFNSHDFTSALADFRKSSELGSDNQDYTYFRIWIIRSRIGEREAATEELKKYLEHRPAKNTSDWPLQVGLFLSGQLGESNFLAVADSQNLQTSKEQHCEAYFYIGSKRLIAGDKMGAVEFFKKCKTTNLMDFEEYQSATSELLFLDMPVSNLK